MDRSAAVELLRGLVAIPSLSRQESAASAWLVEQMRQAGYDRAFVDEAGNAVGELGRASEQRTIVLLGHIDTVAGNIPVRIERATEGDVLFGRGSVDAKGPLATFVAAAARAGSAWAHAARVRVVVVGAVEEESATSRGARAVGARFIGRGEPIPVACVIGEPSHWQRITLGYKGRLLLDLSARQPMAHTAGPDPGVATAIVDLWNDAVFQAAGVNHQREKVFDQLSPSLRRIVTTTTTDMFEAVEAQIAWRLPVDVDIASLANELIARTALRLGADSLTQPVAIDTGSRFELRGKRTTVTGHFRGHEHAWRGDRQNALVRSFLTAIREHNPAVQPGFVVKTGTSDMNVVGPLWRCPIVAYGPGDSALDHTPNEHVSLDEYWRAVVVLEAVLRRLAE